VGMIDLYMLGMHSNIRRWSMDHHLEALGQLGLASWSLGTPTTRPDGFIGRLCQTCLQIIKGDIIKAISAVWRRDFRIFWLLNTTFIMLIPKKDHATNVKDYRPISLIHSIAILITKILTNILINRLDKMVSNKQSTFIKRRFIEDKFMLV
jgi:hypothetical protein